MRVLTRDVKSRIAAVLSFALILGVVLAGTQTATVAFASPVTAPSATISGGTAVGSVLTASYGTWNPSDAVVTYQWMRGTSPIAGEVLASYTTVTADIGESISVDVTGTSDLDTATVSSNAIKPQGALQATSSPVISDASSGTKFLIGNTLTVSASVFSPSATSFDYQWKRNGSDISGATYATYDVVLADAGRAITVVVTGHLTDYTDALATSGAVTGVGEFTPLVTPTVSGTVMVGSLLTADPQSWTPAPTLFEYQWIRGSTDILGATEITYTPVALDVGNTLSVRVTAKRFGFTPGSYPSDVSVAVVPADFGTVGTASITESGLAIGQVLTSHTTGWAPAPDSYEYQWFRDGQSISLATSSTYSLTGLDRGKAITVRVTAVKAGLNNASATSGDVDMPLSTFVISPAPTIVDGAPGTQFLIGHTLTVSKTGFTPAATRYDYQWKRGGSDISGETNASYVVTEDDAGESITVLVTANSDYYAQATSETAAVVGIGEFTTKPLPTISGSATVASELVAATGTWLPTPTAYEYQWKRGGVDIAGETAERYTLVAEDVETAISVSVTAKRVGFTPATRTSLQTLSVAKASFGATGLYSIDYTTLGVGDTLSATTTDWTPQQGSFTYQWRRGSADIGGATGGTYDITGIDRGTSISVRIVAKLAGYNDSSVTSDPVSVPLGDFVVSPTPEIVDDAPGTPFLMGHTLTVSTAGFSPTATSYTYQWKRGGVDISGETHATYVVAVEDAGVNITVVVTGHHAFYTDAPSESDPVVPIGVFTGTPQPTITGTATVGEELTADTAAWVLGATSYDYQWFRGDDPISLATDPTYTLIADDAGEEISVSVTANRNDFQSATRTSLRTALVSLASFTDAGTVTITYDNLAVGGTLTAATTDWTPQQGLLEFQWYRGPTLLAGDDGSTHDITSEDRGFPMFVRVTAKLAGFADSPLRSSGETVELDDFVVDPGGPVIADDTAGTQFLIGDTLTVSTDAFSPSPTVFEYQWKRGGVDISNETQSTYVVALEDVGLEISVAVTARLYQYNPATSESAPVIAAGEFTTTPLPTISGITAVDSVLTADPQTWDPVPTSYSYEWSRDGAPISGETESTYTLTGDDVDMPITVSVTADRFGFAPSTQTSEPTELISKATFRTSGSAALDYSGLLLDDVVTAVVSDWVPAQDLVTYQWLRSGEEISGATDETYTIASEDFNKPLSVQVTASLYGYEDSVVTSPAVTVPKGLIDVLDSPTISGNALVCGTLTVSYSGIFSPDPDSVAIQWFRNDVAIVGATGDDYRLIGADSGKDITVRVTAMLADYNDEPATSEITTVDIAIPYAASPTPRISGVAIVGRTLTAEAGTWDPEPTEFFYQWKRNGSNIVGATDSSYELTADDLTRNISVTIEPSLEGYLPIVRTSSATSGVLAATFGPDRPAPTITGVNKVGQTLTAELDGWTPTPTSFLYQWKRDGRNIAANATGATYLLTVDDLAKKISVRVTPVKAGYIASAVTSLATDFIALGEWEAPPTPTIAGTVVQGQTLTANIDPWSPVATFTYQWKRDDVAILGEVNRTHIVTAADAGSYLSVSATGSRAGFLSATVDSDPTVDAVPFFTFVGVLAPVISGDGRVGGVLTANISSLTPAPTSVTYQWQLNDEDIDGATNSTYLPGAEDIFGYVSVIVSAAKAGYSGVSESSEDPVSIAEGTIGLLTRPVITGTPRVGRTLTATLGEWNTAVDSFTVQWFRDGDPVDAPRDIDGSGVSTARYSLTSDDLGTRISFGVLASKEGFADESTMSEATAEIALTAFNASPVPTITGTAKVANTLTAVPGMWSPNPTSFTYQWTRDGVNIPLAITPTYVLDATDAAHRIRVQVTGLRDGYAVTPQTSLPTASVALGTFTTTPVPTVSGTARVGLTLTATAGSWSPATTLDTFAWQRNGVPLSGASGSTYVLTADDLGQRISVVQRGERSGYVVSLMTSAPTSAVAAGRFTLQPVPTVTGRVIVGSTLSANTGTWSPTASTLSYQWKRTVSGATTTISLATGSTYLLQPIDAGATISVSVTAARPAYTSVTKTSLSTIAVESLSFLDTVMPSISGVEKVESVLTATTGIWTPVPTTLTYQWKRTVLGTTTSISGATAPTYTLVGLDAGAKISVEVTGAKLGYSNVTETSDFSGTIAKGTLQLSPVPTLTGTPQVGVAYAVTTGIWGPAPVAFEYQWVRGSSDISGAIAPSYTPVAADVGGLLSVRVTGKKVGYDDVVRTSAASAAAIVLGSFAAPSPTVTGVAQVGVTLTAVPGTWSPATSPTSTYQWSRTIAGVTTPISGATLLTYTPEPADIEATLSFAVSGGLLGYVTLTKTSVATLPVVAGTFSVQGVASVAGVSTPSRVGEVLTASATHWTPLETSVAYQWMRDGVAMSGFTGSTYTAVAADRNRAITVVATPTKLGYVAGAATSAARTISPGVFATPPTPRIAGLVQVNSLLTATPGTWLPTPTLTYQWKRGGVNISGATSATYLLQPADAESIITVTTTATLAGYTTASVTSAATVAVAKIAFTVVPEPTFTGTVAVGQVLTAVPGSWTPATVAITYRWVRDSTTIVGATTATYTITAADLGSKLRVFVTGELQGYITQESPSAQTVAVVRGTLSTTPVPTITGTSQVGVPLTAVPGTWAPTRVTLSYQWKRGASDISGATAATYTPLAADVGLALSVVVTGSKSGYTSVSTTSAITANTLVGVFGTAPVPTISGSAQVGVPLTAVTGTWLPAPDSFTYQWKRAGVNISGANSATYTPGSADLRSTLTVEVTGVRAGYTSAVRLSAATRPVVIGTIATPTSLPAISGTPTVGQTLTTSNGSPWPSGATFRYQWMRNGVAIPGETANTHVLVADDSGAILTVSVRGIVAGYVSLSVTSNSVGPIAAL